MPATALRDRAAAPLLGAVLLASLLLAGVLAFQAQQAARDHRAAAERVLRDYAALAADTFLAEAEARLAYDVIYHVLGAMGRAEDAAPMRPLPDDREFATVVAEPGQAALVRSRFRLDLRDGGLAASAATPAAVSEWLRRELYPRAREQDSNMGQPRFAHATLDGDDRVFVYSVPPRRPGARTAVLGFEVDLRAARPYLETVFAEKPLLPPSLTRGQVRNESVSLRLSDSRGRPLFESARPIEPRLAATRVATDLDLLRGAQAEASIDGAAAPKLIIGGVPRSRLPLLMAVLVLAVSLAAVALALTARERALSRLRTDFVAGVSHELRTPVTQIRMFAETLLLDRVRSEEERVRSLRIIDQEARRLAHLVENVLLFSRGERGRVSLTRRPLRLDAFLADTAAAFAPLAASRGTAVRVVAAPDAELYADEDALRQVLLNLLDNALKYGPAGQEVLMGAEIADGSARLWIEDRGPGIPEPQREHVWQRYVRLPRDQGGPIAGAGIGLAVVHELVELHGGRARIESTQGTGTRVLIDLPLPPRADGGGSS